jgi:SAM-dependent methyltransferase
MNARSDAWSSGEYYEDYMGRWSRLVAARFVSWLGLPRQWHWLDVGCGTGALTAAILEAADPREVLGIDPSAAYIEHARRRVADPRVSFEVGTIEGLPAGTRSFDAVVSGLVLNFMPSPAQGMRELVRVLSPGGSVAAYVWDYAGEMQVLRAFWDAAGDLDDAAMSLDEGRRFPMCTREALGDLFASCTDGVEVTAIDVQAVFDDFEDYWTPFLGGQGPAPGFVASLGEERRVELRELLRKRLPAATDGSIALTVRAWAARGRI